MSLFRKTISDLTSAYDEYQHALELWRAKKGPDPSVDENLKFRRTYFEHLDTVKKELGEVEKLGVLLREYHKSLSKAVDNHDFSKREEMRKHLAHALSLVGDIEKLVANINKDSKLLE